MQRSSAPRDALGRVRGFTASGRSNVLWAFNSASVRTVCRTSSAEPPLSRIATSAGSVAWVCTRVNVEVLGPAREAEPATRKIRSRARPPAWNVTLGRLDVDPHGLGALMRPVHLEDVEVGRRDELVAVGQEQRVEVVDELRDVRHVDLVGVAVEGVERQGGDQGVAEACPSARTGAAC